MSFSSDVKEELSRQIPAARHCQIAEIAAIFALCGQIRKNEQGESILRIQTENAYVARKYFTLLKKTFNIEAKLSVKQNQKENTYLITVSETDTSKRILEAIKQTESPQEGSVLVHKIIIQRQCCKRAFVRGAFLAAGSISDPNRFYHFEIVCQDQERAEQLCGIISSFDVEARIVSRKNHYVVYVKEGDQIVRLLGVMEANIALMNLENIRILKEMRGSVNRKVNCETANLNKTVNAAVRQIEDIRYIERTIGFSALPEGLEEIARMRLAHPEASLVELGKTLTPVVGKSGVNHRLRKLKEIAEDLRRKQGGELL
ncbi:MAG: DNA-binding protein WhiA [Fusicatenibacter sp.]|nr:DNA-binding protein WhiA [Lachnospiraceae bacterium]MDY2938052.1 DNA-binding protein WhiA [Fusicatenibacter sp.]